MTIREQFPSEVQASAPIGRRQVLQGAVGAAAFTLAGGYGLRQAMAQARSGTLIAAMYQDPQGLDPQQSSQTESFQAMLACFEQLYDYDPATDKFYPQLASEMPDTTDPVKVVIPLRHDVLFHDGTPMTAEDVAYTFNFIIEKGPASPAFSLYNMVTKVEAVDKHKAVFHLKYGYGLLVNYLASVMGGIVRKGAREAADLRRNPAGAGCGPFEFVEWVQGSHLTFRRFKKYFRKDVPGVETLTYKILREDATRVAQLVGGAINFIDEPPKRDFARLIARNDIKGAKGLSEKVGYLMVNHANKTMSNVHLRRALSYATNRKALLDGVYEGYGVPAYGPMRPGTAWYDPAVEPISGYDPDKGRAALKASGLINVKFALRCENNTHHIDASTLLQAMWAEIGVNVDVVPMEKTAFYDFCALGKPGWEVGYTDWSSSVYTPDYMIKLLYQSQGSFQRSQYSNPEVDRLIEAAQRSSNAEEQKKLFSRLQLLMAEDVAALWMVWFEWTPVWRKEVKGFHIAPTYYDYFDNVTVD